MNRSKLVACLGLCAVTACAFVRADDYNSGDRKPRSAKLASRFGFRKGTDAAPTPLSRWFKNAGKSKDAVSAEAAPIFSQQPQSQVPTTPEFTRGDFAPIVSFDPNLPQMGIGTQAARQAPAVTQTFPAPTASMSTGGCGSPDCDVCNPCQCESCQPEPKRQGFLGFPRRRGRRFARLKNRKPSGSRLAGRRRWGFVDSGISPPEQGQRYPYQTQEYAYYHRPYNYNNIPEAATNPTHLSQVTYQSPYSNEFFSALYERHAESLQMDFEPEPTPLIEEPAIFDLEDIEPEHVTPPTPANRSRASWWEQGAAAVQRVTSRRQSDRSTRSDNEHIGVWR